MWVRGTLSAMDGATEPTRTYLRRAPRTHTPPPSLEADGNDRFLALAFGFWLLAFDLKKGKKKGPAMPGPLLKLYYQKD